MSEMAIFLHDLEERVREKVLNFFGIENPEDMMLDTEPLFILVREEEVK